MIIFLSGPDTFRSRQKLRQIRERFRREVDITGYNTTTLTGRGLKVEAFEQALLAAPFLAPKRLVVVEELIAAKPSATTEKQLLELLQRPAANQPVAVFWEGELPAGRKTDPLLEFLQQSQLAEAFPRLGSSALVAWYRSQAKRYGLRLEPGALERITERVGDDLWRADGELQKLAAYCHGREGKLADVERMVAVEVEENVFALTDAIGQHRTSDALRLLQAQLRAGVTPLELTAKIGWHCRNLLSAKTWLEDRGGSGNSWELARELGIHPFVAKKTLGQVGNFSLPELLGRYRQLLALDRQMKSSGGNPAALLTLLVARH